MKHSADATVSRRRLCGALRKARDSVGLTQKQVADALDWSPSKLLRIENGQVGVSRTDLWALLTHYGVTDQRLIEEFSALAQQGRKQAWGKFRDVLDADFIVYLGHEGAASVIRQFELTFIPGLLQTAEYAKRLIEELAPPHEREGDRERQLEVRVERQAIFDRPDPPEMFFILDEAVLRRRIVDDAGIMRRQLRKLKEMNEKPHVNIDVVPLAAGFHPGMLGAFVILEFPETGDGDLLYIENRRRGRATREDHDEIQQYKDVFRRLQEVSDRRPLDEVLDRILREP